MPLFNIHKYSFVHICVFKLFQLKKKSFSAVNMSVLYISVYMKGHMYVL